MLSIWQKCLSVLESEFSPQQFNTWLRPLQVEAEDGSRALVLLAPNRFVVDWVKKNFFNRIKELVTQFADGKVDVVQIEIGSKGAPVQVTEVQKPQAVPLQQGTAEQPQMADPYKNTFLNAKFDFDTFVEGKSNQLSRAAALQVAEKPIHASWVNCNQRCKASVATKTTQI